MGSNINIQELIEEGNSIGGILHGERLTLGKTLDDVSNDLKIRKSDIEAIEANNVANIDRPEFASGSIRTYARYLDLDPKEVLDIYREKNGLKAVSVTPSKVPPKLRHKNTAMNIGYYNAPRRSPISTFLRTLFQGALSIAPLALLIGGGATAVFFGFKFFTSMQELQVVPTESQPSFATVAQIDATDAIAQVNYTEAPTINYDELYARQALSVPVITLRDGPIAEIATTQTTSADGEIAVEVAQIEPVSEPMVSVGPIIPKVDLLPMGEAWVQLSTDAGDTLFEKLLKPGEVVPVPIEGAVNFLKAGNATQLYVRVNGEVFGPIGQDGTSVVRNVPMLPTELKVNFESVTPERLAALQSVETSYLARLEEQ